MGKEKNSFVLYTDYWEQINLLSTNQKGELLTAIFLHAMGKEPEQLDAMCKMAYAFISSQMDRDFNKWEETVRKRREAGKKGGLAKASNARECLANQADNVIVNDTVTVNDNDNDNDSDSESAQGRQGDPYKGYKGAQLDKPVAHRAPSPSFDFDVVCEQIRQAYEEMEDYPYSEKEVETIFKTYFKYYRKYRGREHPKLSTENIRQIMNKLPYIDENHGCTQDIEASQYEQLISKHFRTKYEDCDYNINHFVSGRIRDLRFFEECY